MSKPECKRCGFHGDGIVNGYCSTHCRDMHGVEQERDKLKAKLAEAEKEIEVTRLTSAASTWGRTYRAQLQAEVEARRQKERADKLEAECAALREALKLRIGEGTHVVTRYQKYAGRQIPIRVTCRTCETTINLKAYGTPRNPDKALTDLAWHEPGCTYADAMQILRRSSAGAKAAEVLKAADKLEKFASRWDETPRRAAKIELNREVEFAELLSDLYEKVRAKRVA